MKTQFIKQTDINRKWYVVDATDQVVGRLATRLAKVLVGKHKPHYTPHIDDGDYVVVVNAEKVRFTSNKWQTKKYYRHSQRAGKLKVRTAEEMLAKKPTEILQAAVWGMMNKTHLARRQLLKLKLYAGDKHPHIAQNPVAMKW